MASRQGDPRRSKLDPLTNWIPLAQAFRELLTGNGSSVSFEGNYRFAYTLVTSQHGQFLYENTSNLIKGYLDEESWIFGITSVSGLDKIATMLVFLERVYCRPRNLVGIKETGLRLFTRRVLRAQIFEYYLKKILRSRIEAVAKDIVVDIEPLKSFLGMLLHLEQTVPGADIFRTMFLLPFLRAKARDSADIRQFLTENGEDEVSLPVVRYALRYRDSSLTKGLPQSVTAILMSLFSIQDAPAVENRIENPATSSTLRSSSPPSDNGPQLLNTTFEVPQNKSPSYKPIEWLPPSIPAEVEMPSGTQVGPFATATTFESRGWTHFVPCGPRLPGRYQKKTTNPKGFGGFSDIWICDVVFDDHAMMVVALKELRAVSIAAANMQQPELTIQRMLARLQREVYVWSALSHPHIVPLIGYQFYPTMCLLSPWYNHGHVMAYLQQNPNTDRKKLVRQVAAGILYLHSRDDPVIHGDIKPDNILINDEGDVVISDFGLSQVMAEISPQYSSSTLRTGNPRWLAPELYSDDEVRRSTASDVYAFGCVVLEIITGAMPFRKLGDIRVAVAVAQAIQPVSNLEDYPEMPAGDPFWPILFDCWKSEPGDRPTIQEIEDTLKVAT